MRIARMLLILAVTGCAAPEDAPDAELAAVRAVSMSGPALSWQAMRIHPALLQRPCSVGTLVDEQARVVGYCNRGRQCRTNDWRPVMDGCEADRAPPMSPAPAGSALEIAGRR